MRYRVFLLWNALGGITWGITFSLVGYFAGASYEKVASTIGKGAAVVVAVLVVAGVVVWRVRRRRREGDHEPESVTTPDDACTRPDCRAGRTGRR